MKTTTIKAIFITLWIAILLASCKKETPKNDSFDINNLKLEEYCIYANFNAKNGAFKNQVRLFEFIPGNNLKIYSAESDRGYQYSYVIKNSNTIDVEGELYNINFDTEGKIVSIKHSNDNFLFESPVLIKKPATDQLAGKIFAGRYYTQQGTDIHNKNLIYKFRSDGKVEAGFDVNNPVRTENYNPIGNIAATTRITGMVNSYEIMVLVNGKLQVNTRNGVANPARIEYGSFTQQ